MRCSSLFLLCVFCMYVCVCVCVYVCCACVCVSVLSIRNISWIITIYLNIYIYKFVSSESRNDASLDSRNKSKLYKSYRHLLYRYNFLFIYSIFFSSFSNCNPVESWVIGCVARWKCMESAAIDAYSGGVRAYILQILCMVWIATRRHIQSPIITPGLFYTRLLFLFFSSSYICLFPVWIVCEIAAGWQLVMKNFRLLLLCR